MNDEQVMSAIMSIKQDMAAIQESLKSAHKRIDDNDALTAQIHKLAASIETLAYQVKNQNEQAKIQNERMEKIIETLEKQIRNHGERIGVLEHSSTAIEHNKKVISKLFDKVEVIEKEPATKWKELVKQVAAIVVAAIVGGVIMYITGGK